MAKKDGTTEVATLVGGIQEERPDWLKKGNAGSEDVSMKDMILPRIDVLQALSPQIKKSDPGYIPGAEQGQIFNTVTGEIYGTEVTFVPVMFRKEFVLWKLRQHGGGFIGAFSGEQEANMAHSQVQTPSECEVVESHQHFVMILTPHGTEEAVLSMTKSKLKVSRNLNTLIQMAGVDRFAKAYKISSIEVDGDKGSYWSYKAAAAGFVTQELYNKGKELYDMIKAGAADVDRTVSDEAGPVPHTAEL